MKILTVFVILCLAEIQATSKLQQIKKACIEHNGFNATYVEALETTKRVNEYLPFDKWTCIFACMLERNLREGQTMYKVISENIEEDIPISSTKYNRKGMLDRLNECKAKFGENGCEFFKCLKVTEEPFDSYLRIPHFQL